MALVTKGQGFQYVTVFVWKNTHVKRYYLIKRKGGKQIGNFGDTGAYRLPYWSWRLLFVKQIDGWFAY